eukprot:SAG31_NODE_8921_length_1363_cov_1.099684_2_plen_96_part_01
MLLKAGFIEIKETQPWKLEPGGKYFFTRNMSSLVAFAIGAKASAGAPFVVVGSHTDSPCPKLKPASKRTKAGYLQVLHHSELQNDNAVDSLIDSVN